MKSLKEELVNIISNDNIWIKIMEEYASKNNITEIKELQEHFIYQVTKEMVKYHIHFDMDTSLEEDILVNDDYELNVLNTYNNNSALEALIWFFKFKGKNYTRIRFLLGGDPRVLENYSSSLYFNMDKIDFDILCFEKLKYERNIGNYSILISPFSDIENFYCKNNLTDAYYEFVSRIEDYKMTDELKAIRNYIIDEFPIHLFTEINKNVNVSINNIDSVYIIKEESEKAFVDISNIITPNNAWINNEFENLIRDIKQEDYKKYFIINPMHSDVYKYSVLGKKIDDNKLFITTFEENKNSKEHSEFKLISKEISEELFNKEINGEKKEGIN